MSEEEMNDNLLMLKYFLKEEGDENWEDYCNAINKALNLISNLQKELDKKDKVIDLMADKLSERSEWYTKERWKEICYKQVEKVGGEDE